MTYASDATVNTAVDFASIARDLGANRGQNLNIRRELVPAEAQSRMQREGANFRRPNTNGVTVDQEGLTNNYAVEPEMYAAVFPSPEQARQYALQAAAAALLVVGLIATSAAIS
ncbi:MAG: photosystem II assembly protein Psb34 [Thainema sp.]